MRSTFLLSVLPGWGGANVATRSRKRSPLFCDSAGGRVDDCAAVRVQPAQASCHEKRKPEDRVLTKITRAVTVAAKSDEIF